MGKPDKKLCKWHKEDIENNLVKLIKMVRKPKYLCSKCGRVCKDKTKLCKPMKLEKV